MTTNTASHVGAGDDSAGPVRVGDLVAEKYVVERALGVGGMGVVVAARDRVLDRRVAIKFLLPKLVGSETAVQRFTREARAATRITSEHVVRLLEIEKLPDGTPFFVMEYLEGSDLRALLRDQGALPASLAVDYLLQAAQAVAEGHVKGVVHRDLKPSNLFLTRRADGTALIKVLDFGIAKTTEREEPESNALTSSDDVRLGSPAYMPPEQLQDARNVDTRSDIWSLGATLYELVCGRPPFEGNGYLELATRILKDPPVPLAERDVPRPLPAGLELVLRKCLEKDRERRYANAAELAAALAPFGSEDARISLTRVSGMFGSSSLPALTREVAIENTDCEPTLDVAGDSGRDRRSSVPTTERRTSELGVVASDAPAGGRRSQVIALAAVAVVAVVALLRNQSPGSQAASSSPLPRSAPPSLRPAVPVAPAPASPPPALLDSSAATAAAPPARPSTEKPKLAGAAPSRPSTRTASTASNVFTASPASAPTPATEPASLQVGAGTQAPAPSASERSGAATLGRSEEIERLIEQRR